VGGSSALCQPRSQRARSSAAEVDVSASGGDGAWLFYSLDAAVLPTVVRAMAGVVTVTLNLPFQRSRHPQPPARAQCFALVHKF
jgi:hypothetical protein